MILNFKIFQKNNLNPTSLYILIMLKNSLNKELEDNITQNQEMTIMSMVEDGLLTYIKGKKEKQGTIELLRLSKTGKNVLRDLQIADMTDESLEVASAIIEMYEAKGLESKVTNKRQTVKLMGWFMAETEFTKEQILSAVDTFLNTTEPTYISQTHNLIWRGDNVFATKPKLEESKLYNLLKG